MAALKENIFSSLQNIFKIKNPIQLKPIENMLFLFNNFNPFNFIFFYTKMFFVISKYLNE